MRKLRALPKGYKAVLTNGQSILYVSDEDKEKAVLENPRAKTFVELPLHSALARGYWEEIPKGKK